MLVLKLEESGARCGGEHMARGPQSDAAPRWYDWERTKQSVGSVLQLRNFGCLI